MEKQDIKNKLAKNYSDGDRKLRIDTCRDINHLKLTMRAGRNKYGVP